MRNLLRKCAPSVATNVPHPNIIAAIRDSGIDNIGENGMTLKINNTRTMIPEPIMKNILLSASDYFFLRVSTSIC